MNDLFSLTDFAYESQPEQKLDVQKARAFQTKKRHIAKRAKSEQVLSEILPNSFEENDCWHVLSSGDVDSLSYVAHILKSHKIDYLLLSTWCLGNEDALQIRTWLDTLKIQKIDCYVGEIFPSQYAEAYETLSAIVKTCSGRVCVFKNHSKIFLIKSGNQHFVIESSANVNTNPRTENTVITLNQDLFLHHLDYFNNIKSFNRDFDGWSENGKYR